MKKLYGELIRCIINIIKMTPTDFGQWIESYGPSCILLASRPLFLSNTNHILKSDPKVPPLNRKIDAVCRP